MNHCQPEIIDRVLTCPHCGVPFSGRFAISEAELAKIGGRLDRIFRPCGSAAAASAPASPPGPLAADCDATATQNHRRRVRGLESPPRSARATRELAACVHRGELVRTEVCKSCSGTRKIKIFRCAVHGICELSGKLPGVPYCGTCEEFCSAGAPASAGG